MLKRGRREGGRHANGIRPSKLIAWQEDNLHTYNTHTYNHRDCKTELAYEIDSVKIPLTRDNSTS